MRSFRYVILCADDFGLADGVSRGIVELAWKGRLSATGAMTNAVRNSVRPIRIWFDGISCVPSA